MQQHHGLLERHRMPDLHLAVRPLQHAQAQEQDERRRLLNALQHALLGDIGGAVVVPAAVAEPLELEVEGISLVTARGL